MAKQIYVKQSDTYKQADQFNLIATPCGLNAAQEMPADCAPSPGKANAYDGGANSKSASE